ncbi:MAG: hypothetical protein WD771_07720 [Gemmatimonadaceae bacterium]
MKIDGPDQIAAHYASVLGDEFGKVYFELVNENVWLHDKWREYQALFARSVERVEVLNSAAARFFGQLDGILWEDVLLHLCRLTDPVEVMRHKQLTVQRIPLYVADVTRRATLEAKVAKAVESTAFARDWRNRHIGHRSLNRAIDSSARPLAHASRASVEAALEGVDDVFHYVHETLLDSGLSFDVPGGPGDVDDLIGVLSDGLRAQAAREERFRTYQLLPEDINPPEAV